MNIRVEIGRVAQSLAIDELTIRAMDRGDEYGGFGLDDDYAPPIPRTELRVQGRLRNASGKTLTGVRYDVSYYDCRGAFLGLDRSGLFEDDELDPDDFLAIDMALSMPDDTHRCVFNVRAKRPGWVRRWL